MHTPAIPPVVQWAYSDVSSLADSRWRDGWHCPHPVSVWGAARSVQKRVLLLCVSLNTRVSYFFRTVSYAALDPHARTAQLTVWRNVGRVLALPAYVVRVANRAGCSPHRHVHPGCQSDTAQCSSGPTQTQPRDVQGHRLGPHACTAAGAQVGCRRGDHSTTRTADIMLATCPSHLVPAAAI